MNTTRAEKSVKKILLGKCWNYFNDNFHKLSQANKIKVALALCTREMQDRNPEDMSPEKMNLLQVIKILNNGKVTTVENRIGNGQDESTRVDQRGVRDYQIL